MLVIKEKLDWHNFAMTEVKVNSDFDILILIRSSLWQTTNYRAQHLPFVVSVTWNVCDTKNMRAAIFTW